MFPRAGAIQLLAVAFSVDDGEKGKDVPAAPCIADSGILERRLFQHHRCPPLVSSDSMRQQIDLSSYARAWMRFVKTGLAASRYWNCVRASRADPSAME